jgi:hypothetical protein
MPGSGSYANFYIANGLVLVKRSTINPTASRPTHRPGLSRDAKSKIPSVDLVLYLGFCVSLSHQQGACSTACFPIHGQPGVVGLSHRVAGPNP